MEAGTTDHVWTIEEMLDRVGLSIGKSSMNYFAALEYRLLLKAFPADPDHLTGNAYRGRNKLKVLLGDDVFDRLRGKTVVDFGCGYGDQTIELAQQGADRAVGIDIREGVLEKARAKAAGQGNVEFLNATCNRERAFADFVLSIDAFEHFADPGGALLQMHSLLKPGGTLLVSFGPPWRHPFGGHTFAVFPWSHLLLSEQALCRWYNAVKRAEVSRFEEVSGGLNRMTIVRFERLARSSPFRNVSVRAVPIRKLRLLHNRLTREFTTAVVRASLER
jgi:SAM-dependent methyltransferase